ncbi:hypothetical protein J3R30DRAFT_1337821 [Lentinula aciculospora]|uniref:F-box domain-containing protein n=1 Tax=Lentinula aciculospora TaxID=153920 RepID=A0A9W9AL15_9AGAR|nr:hypothetical protein J3R30DRAFT_1337821 [Lentinula aciculospora]
MPRRSARIQAANTANDSQHMNATQAFLVVKHPRQEVEVEEELSEEERLRKRRKRASASGKTKKGSVPKPFRKVRGRLGLLERMAKDVPVEIILEVFCYLQPRDLLRLARTSLELRNILMSKTSEDIWLAARQNVKDLPPRPRDLSEPQYAYLLYEPCCHVCDRRVVSVLWSFRMRCCKFLLNRFPVFDDEFLAKQPKEIRDSYILPRELIQTTERWGFVSHNGIAARYKAEFETLQTPEERDAWLDRKREEKLQSRKHTSLCGSWFNRREAERTLELNHIRESRKEDILSRLGEIGWREEAEIMMKIEGCSLRRITFSRHKLVKQPRKLTDYGWNAIKDELLKLLSDHKEERTKAESNIGK